MKGKSVLDNRIVSTVILVILLGFVVWIWYWLPSYLAADLKSITDKGLFGDSYGSVTSLFTGLAFAALIFTIILQQREIKLQREDFLSQLEEMKLSRQDVNRQTDVYEKQVRLGIAELKLRAREVKIEYIKMESLQWVEAGRVGNSGPKLEAVRLEMEEIINDLRE